jgi:acetylornithine deacetylase
MTGPVLAELNELDRTLASRPPHPLLGHGTLHASLISGGTEPSTIPEHCTLVVERRTLPGETENDVHADLTSLIDRCARRFPHFTARTRTLLARAGLETPEAEPIAEATLAASARLDGVRGHPVGLSYWADSAFLSAAGIPAILFGPSGDGAHAEVEWVSTSSARACAEVLTAVAVDFCR